VRCVWDEKKNETNAKKHGISFQEASVLFDGRDYREAFDVEHSDHEDRFIGIGPVGDRLLFVSYSEPDIETVRIISAREATRAEIALYHEYLEGQAQ
jgi:uncharacterized DUF497 family protein